MIKDKEMAVSFRSFKGVVVFEVAPGGVEKTVPRRLSRSHCSKRLSLQRLVRTYCNDNFSQTMSTACGNEPKSWLLRASCHSKFILALHVVITLLRCQTRASIAFAILHGRIQGASQKIHSLQL